MITKQSGYYIINGNAVSVKENQVVSYPDHFSCEEFSTEEEMLAEYKHRYPEKSEIDEL